MGSIEKCPVLHGGMEPQKGGPTRKQPTSNKDWWPNALNLKILHQNHINDPQKNRANGPLKSYAEEFKSLDLNAVKKDIVGILKTSQDWWPADYGHYGPFMIRMAWHSVGTYRTFDGRGGGCSGNLRFAPLNSWPDNGNLDKAKRLLWPVKKKYGRKISWADLMVLTGNVALEDMGFPTFGFAGGREDIWEPEDDVNWGIEDKMLNDDKRYVQEGRVLDHPLGAVQMGLIYVNPEGPEGGKVNDPVAAAHDIRDTFGRMAMGDEETVALIAGGHTFGKAHGAADPGKYVGPEPEGNPNLEAQGFGWTNSFESGKGAHAITSGLEGAWTAKPAQWDNGYFHNLFKYDWEKSKSPAGATQWVPTDKSADVAVVPDAHIADKTHVPIMFTTDLALKFDPAYAEISKRFHENEDQFKDAFGRAWYKLCHRDMGPLSRCLGPEVPGEALIWQDPLPAKQNPPLTDAEADELKAKILGESGLSIAQLVSAAWASASTYRGTDHRGGANGARIRLAPQKDWEVNNPAELQQVLQALEKIQGSYTAKKVSLADLIVLGGCAGVEEAARRGGSNIRVPFTPGRVDAVQEQTDVVSFGVLEPVVDGFRNFVGKNANKGSPHLERTVEEHLIDRAHMLNLTAPEMTVLVGGLRVLNANTDKTASLGVLTDKAEQLTNDYFVNLTDMGIKWSHHDIATFAGKDRATGQARYIATRADLIFGHNSQLRAIAEYYACDDMKQIFVEDFVAAWNKVMNLDRFDV